MQFYHTIQLFERDPKLVDQFFDAVISIDQNFEIVYWNFGAQNLFGYSREEALGLPLDAILISLDGIITDNMKYINGGWRGEVKYRRKDESVVDCLLSFTAITTAARTKEYLLISQDISEKIELRNLLKKISYDFAEKVTTANSTLEEFYERIDEGFIAFDREWNYTHINSKAAFVTGRKPEELIGKNVWEEFPKSREGSFYRVYHEAMETQEYRRVEEYSAYLDRWFQVDAYPSIHGLSVFFRDITEKKNTERLLSEREELYRKIVETAQEGIWTIDENNKTTFVNTCMAGMLGYQRQEFIGREPFDFLTLESMPIALDNLATLRNGQSHRMDYALVTKNRGTIWVLVHATPLYHDTKYVGALAMVMDITERKNRERELKESHAQLRHLASRLQSIREEERGAIAKEIHDELGQQLTSLKMDAYWIFKNLSPLDTMVNNRLQSIMRIASETLALFEKKAMALHPALLDDLGLIAAIEWQNKEFQTRYEISFHFSCCGSDKDLDNNAAIALYRIYQEALTNVARHARAVKINTSFSNNGNQIVLAIEDDGIGFDTALLPQKKSLGIVSMKERSIMLGGNFELYSSMGYGTKIVVVLPVNKTSDENLAC